MKKLKGGLKPRGPASDKRTDMTPSMPAGTAPRPVDAPANSTDRVSDLVQKLVAAATAEVENAAQRTRAQAQIEIGELQLTIDRLQQQLHEEHDKLKAASVELTLARATASQLKEELEAERAEKARFAATLETVRLMVSGMDPEPHCADPTPPSTMPLAEADDDLTDDDDAGRAPLPEFRTADAALATSHRSTPAAPAAGTGTGTASAFDTNGHLAQLLGQIEEIYRSDLKLAEGTSEVVARLGANIEYARDAFARRLDSTDVGDAALFDRHLASLLDARSGTPFGRHLAMAVGKREPSHTAATGLRHRVS
jgi:hypothetical protein